MQQLATVAALLLLGAKIKAERMAIRSSTGPYERLEKLGKYRDEETYRKLIPAMLCIEEAFKRYPLGGQGKAACRAVIAFNGGKDCLVVLHLIRAYLDRINRLDALPEIVYFHGTEEEFEEVIDFMNEVERELNVKITVLRGGFKRGLEELVTRGTEAVFMGQRKTDPRAPPTCFSPTSEGWPPIVRINPILDLDYAGVWGFLRGCGYRYCALYDAGYTSLGGKHNTQKHPDLVKKSSSAFELQDERGERGGREREA